MNVKGFGCAECAMQKWWKGGPEKAEEGQQKAQKEISPIFIFGPDFWTLQKQGAVSSIVTNKMIK